MKRNYSRSVRELAEKLPPSLVEANPEVVAARERLAEAEARSNTLSAQVRTLNARRAALDERVDDLQSEIEDLRARLPGIALAAFEGGDDTVQAAVDARVELARLGMQLEALIDAQKGFFASQVRRALLSAAESAGTAVGTAQSNLDGAIHNALLEEAFARD